MVYTKKDYFYKKAKKEGKASRAAYKLSEIQKKFNLIKKGDVVIDLGCSPGGWLEETSKLIGKNGIVIGVDVEGLRTPIPENGIFIPYDIKSPDLAEQIYLRLTNPDVNVVLSDTAPKTSGIGFRDSYRSYELALKALEICNEFLNENGNFLVKVFPGKEIQEYKKTVKKRFRRVSTIIPQATRKSSSEEYLVGISFKRIQQSPR